jgi:pimeloyl-ACP methyl ester carboxylesterase
MNQKDILHFSHANGFPSKTYSIMLEQLKHHYDVRWIDQLAHHPSFPVTDNWDHLSNELEHYFEAHYDRPVIAVGHSLGGVLSYMLAKKRPDLVKKVILLDAPVLDRLGSGVVRLAKSLGFMDYITPAGRTDGRQEHWENKEEAEEYFKGKSLFKNVDSRCLKAYVQHGTQSCAKGICLRFKADTEVKIYRTIPHNLHRGQQRLAVPSAMIFGGQSNVVRGFQRRHMEKKVGMMLERMVGGHLFPLEYPEQTADKIHQIIQRLN